MNVASYPAASTSRFRVARIPRAFGEELNYVEITDLQTGRRQQFAEIDADEQRRWMAAEEPRKPVIVRIRDPIDTRQLGRISAAIQTLQPYCDTAIRIELGQ